MQKTRLPRSARGQSGRMENLLHGITHKERQRQHANHWQDLNPAQMRDRVILRDALMRAVERDNAEEVESLVCSGAPLVTCYPYRTPPDVEFVNPVDWATIEMRFSSAMHILELSDDICAYEHDRRRNVLQPISVAMQTRYAVSLSARYGHVGLLRMLLDRSASIEQSNSENQSPLHVAVSRGNREAAVFLLKRGAWEYEAQQSEVLKLTAECNLEGIFEAASCDRPAKSEEELIDSVTYHSKAAQTGASPLDQTLMPLDSPTARSARSQTPQMLIVPHDHASAHVDNPIATGAARPPHVATRRAAWKKEGPPGHIWHEGAYETERSGSADGISRWGWSPIQSLPITPMAATSGGASAFKRPGSSLSSPPALGSGDVRLRGELNRAIRKGDVDRLRALVVRGAPLEAKFNLGYGEEGTCVDWASVSGHPDSAIALLNLADEQGMGGMLAVASCAALYWSVTNGFLDLLRELLNRGADVGLVRRFQTSEPSESSLLSHAVYSYQPQETMELLRHGAWEKLATSEQEQLLNWVQTHKIMNEVFKAAGILQAGDMVSRTSLPVVHQAKTMQRQLESMYSESQDAKLSDSIVVFKKTESGKYCCP
mmetsp:Transcript_36058/g.64766  ORF Transcript_36058/g.64766 Transcript_36058/m.64766 type:complete len:601 (-) Transcript_36058:168-1970(-)